METINKILVPLTDPMQAPPYLRLAASLLPPEGRVIVLRIVEIPEEESLSVGAETAPIYRAAMERLTSEFPDERVELKTLVRVSRRIMEGIVETAREEASDLILLPWKGYTASPDGLFGRKIDQLLEHPPCNIMIVRAADFSDCRRILLPIRGGPYAEFALDVASRLALSIGAEVTVLHCESKFSSRYADRPYRSFRRKLEFYPHVKRLVTLHGDAKSAIIHESKAHDLVIIGAGFNPEPQTYFLGPLVEHVAQQTDKPLLVVKTPALPVADFNDKVPEESSKSLTERVDKWFAENTFHRREFDELKKLVELKEKRGVSISLGLPALNEAETIENIIRTFKKKLFENIPLLDEIVLIDSGSKDATVKIARNCGIPVHLHQQILPRYGSYRGKGEALWKSLYVLKGDIIVWVDTDIKNIHPGFVYGLLGPLLREPEIQYVKGFYRRPLRSEGKIYAEGGGRVTELTARPFLNLFVPELSGVIQPLAGEYAGRRGALERVPFFTGYGVETGLLIDLFNEFGLRAIAQVDLEERIHRNQSLADLSQMSFAIIQVFVQRLVEKNRIQLPEEVHRSMNLIKHRHGAYALEIRDIRDYERPPMISIPEYRTRRAEVPSAQGAALH